MVYYDMFCPNFGEAIILQETIVSLGIRGTYPVGNCMFKVTTETIEQRCEICSKLTIKTPKRHHWGRYVNFIVNFEQISHLFSSVSIVNFEQVNAG